MNVYASIAHRGSISFLQPLWENVQEFLSPTYNCLFSHSRHVFPKTKTFFERPFNRHGTIDVVRRHMQCHGWITTRFSEDGVLVLVAANQRFFRPCFIQPQTFSLAGDQSALMRNMLLTYTSAISYPSRRWDKLIDRTMLRVNSHLPNEITLFSQHMEMHTPALWRTHPLMYMHQEGSFYPLRMLSRFKPFYHSYYNATSPPVIARFARTFPEESLMPSYLLQQESSRIPALSRPPLCVRVLARVSDRYDTFVNMISHSHSSANNSYCGVKIPGVEHLF
jgi:hypothetical protein